MKYTATITPRLIGSLGTKGNCENALLCVFMNALWLDIPIQNREQNIRVAKVECCTLDIELELNCRSAEIVKDMLHEALDTFLEPEFNSDIDVEINDEL